MLKKVKKLGRYLIIDRIASGGMAEIFKALTFDEDNTQRTVAIKKVLPHLANNKEFIDMLLDEAKLISMMDHPNIIIIYEFNQIGEIVFMAMEYVTGKDLRALLERCRRLGIKPPYAESVYIICEVLTGLDYIHRLIAPDGKFANLVHRDLSPSNILIGYDGVIKICDFGISKAIFSSSITKAGVVKGKVKYMSPEQAYGKKLDHRSDIFSAGTILYELLTGIQPFNGESETDIIFKVRDAKIIPPREIDSGIPPELEEIVFKSMERSKSDRYPSAQKFKEILIEFLEKHGRSDRQVELSLFMRKIWSDELEKEYTHYDYYISEQEEADDALGENLLKDVLGQNALYEKFNPYKGVTSINKNISTKTEEFHETNIENKNKFLISQGITKVSDTPPVNINQVDTRILPEINLNDNESQEDDKWYLKETRIVVVDEQNNKITDVAQMKTKIIDTSQDENLAKYAAMPTRILNIEQQQNPDEVQTKTEPELNKENNVEDSMDVSTESIKEILQDDVENMCDDIIASFDPNAEPTVSQVERFNPENEPTNSVAESFNPENEPTNSFDPSDEPTNSVAESFNPNAEPTNNLFALKTKVVFQPEQIEECKKNDSKLVETYTVEEKIRKNQKNSQLNIPPKQNYSNDVGHSKTKKDTKSNEYEFNDKLETIKK